jgi:hypothetical protein
MVMDPVHCSVDHGRRQSTVDCGQGLGGGSPEDGRNGAPVCGTSPRLRKKGGGTVVILTGCRRGGGGAEPAGHRWARNGRGGARCGQCLGAERRGEGRGAVESGDGPLYIGAEGEATIGD